MKQIDFSDIKIRGELAYRAILNYKRLEEKWYYPDEVFSADLHGWPGDWEGRIILALALYTQSTRREPAYLEEIISKIPEHLNEKGYFGKILPKNVFNEQQMAGHSWFLRSLIEYYQLSKDKNIKSMVDRLVNNYLLPAQGFYSKYPINAENRINTENWELSHKQSKTKTHAETMDTGCAFIMLDGASQAYEFLKLPELKQLIEEMIGRFREMDFAKIQVQTHATLTALRGITRFYELTGAAEYLELVKRIFKLYRTEALTEAYGNYNWFGRPEWTEPCGIIDSFILSVTLWKLTGDTEYLEFAHYVYFNAIAHAQRVTGAVGTDICVGAKDIFLSPLTYEVYWCCTMRAGEGFSRAIQFSYFLNDNELILPFYFANQAVIHFADGEVILKEKTGYPYNGVVGLEVVKSTANNEHAIKFFIPSGAQKNDIQVNINGKKYDYQIENGFLIIKTALHTADKIEINLPFQLYRKDTINHNNIKGYHTFRHGPLILAYENAEAVKLDKTAELIHLGNGRYQVKDKEIMLSPINNIKSLTDTVSRKQILFTE